jgi:Tol biopolymer transport system component
LTISDGLDDGPDYSSDGKYIYFNSYRTGHMQIWRMQSDGTNQEQLTFDDSNWFAHPSPDNKWIAYLSDEKQNHLFGKHVQLKLMNIYKTNPGNYSSFLWRSRHFQCPILVQMVEK